MTPVIGVDPGARHVGLVLRLGDEYLDHAVVTRADDDSLVPTRPGRPPVVLREVLATIMGFRFHRALAGRNLGPVVVAVEGLNEPTGFARGRKALLDPSHMIAAGMVLGAVLGSYRTAVVVAPHGNGRGLLGKYPPELITPAEQRHGLMREAPASSPVSHARSAWDVAGAAVAHLGRSGVQ